MSHNIFICYRREDSSAYAGRIFDRLTKHFHRDRIYLDIDIDPGADFVELIRSNLRRCDILLVLIGDDWLKIVDRNGQNKLQDPNDFVRLEIREALNRKIPVIPILVDGATMPSSADLPEDIETLTRRQAFEIRHTKFDADVNLLVDRLKKMLRKNDVSSTAKQRLFRWGVLAVVAVMIVIVITSISKNQNDTDQTVDRLSVNTDSPRTRAKDTIVAMDTPEVEKEQKDAVRSSNHRPSRKVIDNRAQIEKKEPGQESSPQMSVAPVTKAESEKYRITAHADYYSSPHKDSVTKHSIDPGEDRIVLALDEQHGFILVDYYDRWGMKIRGWLNKKSLTKIE